MTASTPTPIPPPATRPTKAIVGALLAVAAGIASGLTDGRLTWPECSSAVLAGLAALGAVYGVTNRPKGPQ